MNSSTQPDPNRWPPQIKYIVGNEAAERFSYYGMVSILMVYITDVLEKSEDGGTIIIHGFKFVNYFMPLLGAWVSDRLLGRYHTILWISLAYCVGHAVLALGDVFGTIGARTSCLYVGLALIAFGSGGIKPCVSAFLGDQFRSDQSHLLRKAYAAFYWSINFGSFFATLLIPQVKNYSWGWAFAIPGILMGFATLIFWMGRKHYVRIPPARVSRSAGFVAVFMEALRNKSRNPHQFWDGAKPRYSAEEIAAARSVLPILSVFAMIPFFWVLFDQTHSTWVAQGKSMVPVELAFGFKIDAATMQATNPLMVMALVPILTLLVYPRIGKFAAPLKRMVLGFFIAGFSFVVVAWLQKMIEGGGELSILWQTVPYLIITVAEVLISTTGLEFAFREAAASMKSTIMGFWNLTVAFGNLIVMGLTAALSGDGHSTSVSPGRFMMYAGITFAVAVIFTIVASFYKYRDQQAAEGK